MSVVRRFVVQPVLHPGAYVVSRAEAAARRSRTGYLLQILVFLAWASLVFAYSMWTASVSVTGVGGRTLLTGYSGGFLLYVLPQLVALWVTFALVMLAATARVSVRESFAAVFYTTGNYFAIPLGVYAAALQKGGGADVEVITLHLLDVAGEFLNVFLPWDKLPAEWGPLVFELTYDISGPVPPFVPTRAINPDPTWVLFLLTVGAGFCYGVYVLYVTCRSLYALEWDRAVMVTATTMVLWLWVRYQLSYRLQFAFNL